MGDSARTACLGYVHFSPKPIIPKFSYRRQRWAVWETIVPISGMIPRHFRPNNARPSHCHCPMAGWLGNQTDEVPVLISPSVPSAIIVSRGFGKDKVSKLRGKFIAATAVYQAYRDEIDTHHRPVRRGAQLQARPTVENRKIFQGLERRETGRRKQNKNSEDSLKSTQDVQVSTRASIFITTIHFTTF